MSHYAFSPELVHSTAWIAPGAIVVGNVHLHEFSSIWFNAVIRGDTETLTIGAYSNIQDLAMLHADPGFPVMIGERVTVGHRAIVHGATIGADTLIGMGSIVMNGAVIGQRSIVGAGALVTQGQTFEDGVVIVGSPARVMRRITVEDLQNIQERYQAYVKKARGYREVWE